MTDETDTTAVCTSAQSPPDLQYFVERIDQNWRASVDSVMKVAQLCAQAKGALRPPQQKQLLQKTKLERSVFSKLAKIGADPRIEKLWRADKLPRVWATAHELTMFTDEELAASEAAGIVHPGATRREIKAWRNARRGAAAQTTDEVTGDLRWPLPSESVKTLQALDAIEEGHWPTVSRYFLERKPEELDVRVVHAIGEMFSDDPELQQPWRARPKRRHRGKPRPSRWRMDPTDIKLRFAESETTKVESIVKKLEDQGVSRATTFRHREALGMNKKSSDS